MSLLLLGVALISVLIGFYLAKRKSRRRLLAQKAAPFAKPDEGHSAFLFSRFEPSAMQQRASEYADWASQRRSCRSFSSEKIPPKVLENCIRAAGSAPSGAHTEPWKYVVVTDSTIRSQLRKLIEAEEFENYNRRMGVNWVEDLRPIGTDWQKPYLTDCAALVIFFEELYSFEESGVRRTNHYHEISAAMSAGMFVAALHHAGLCTGKMIH